MSRSNWRVLFAIVGLSLVALLSAVSYNLYESSKQQQADYRYQPASKPGFRINGTTQLPSPEYKPNCQNPKTDEDADLCAQWAAVAQVSEANRLASISLRVSLLALFLTALGTGLLVWTLDETRMVSRRELRAYVAAEDVAIADGTHHPDRPLPLGVVGGAIVIKNTGQTPAHRVRHWGQIAIEKVTNQNQLRGPIKLDEIHYTALPSGGTMIKLMHRPRKPSEREIEGIKSGQYAVFLYGRIEYEDVFGDPHHANYRLFYSGAWPPSLNAGMNFSESGNEMD